MINKGPDAMRLAQSMWKQDQAIRAAGGRALYPSWSATLKGAWAQVRRAGLVAAAGVSNALSLARAGHRRAAAILAMALIRVNGAHYYPETRIRLLGLIHRDRTGESLPHVYH